MPWVSILVRKVYGVAGAGHGDGSRLNLRFAWPSGNWGSLPMAGGLEAAYRRELEAADDPEALRAEIAARLEAVTSPFRTAERFSVEEIIDPRDTRPILCDWAERAHELVQHELARRPEGARSAALSRAIARRGARGCHHRAGVREAQDAARTSHGLDRGPRAAAVLAGRVRRHAARGAPLGPARQGRRRSAGCSTAARPRVPRIAAADSRTAPRSTR